AILTEKRRFVGFGARGAGVAERSPALAKRPLARIPSAVMVRSHARPSSVALVALFAFAAGSARAQSSGEDVAAAQALFEDGKRLMQARNYEEACPKLVESQRLDPGGGTLLAIGLCHEGQGRTATAWADFNVALTEARKDRRADREAAALE